MKGRKNVGLYLDMKQYDCAEYGVRKNGNFRCYLCFRSTLGWQFSLDRKQGKGYYDTIKTSTGCKAPKSVKMTNLNRLIATPQTSQVHLTDLIYNA